jgi:hypothetical protein
MAIPAPKLVAVVVKEVPSPGDAVNGLSVPGETSIGYCNLTFGIFKDKKIWGENADISRLEGGSTSPRKRSKNKSKH